MLFTLDTYLESYFACDLNDSAFLLVVFLEKPAVFNKMLAFSLPCNLSQPSLSLFLEDFLYYDSIFNAVYHMQSTIPATITQNTNIKQARQQYIKQYNQEEIKPKSSL